MELTHSFTVPVGIDQAFEVLTDIERIAPCMPGASIESVEGEEFTGRVKVKVGPMQITYRGKARFKELDREQHRVVLDARGQEMRGSGTANATVTASLLEKGDETDVTVVSALSITGRPAQFGRGVMNEIGAKLLGQFADCLSSRLAGDDQGDTDEVAAAAVADTAPREPVTPDIGIMGTPEVTEPVTADVIDPTEPEVTEPVTADVDDTTELKPVASPGSNGSGALTDEEITQVAGVATTQPVTAPEQAASASGPPEAVGGAAQPAGRQTPPRETWSSSSDEAIDLFSVAGPSVAKRLTPIAAVLLLLLLLWRRRRARTR